KYALQMAVGLLAGLFLGIGVAAVWRALGSRITSARDVESAVSAPLLGNLLWDRQASESPLVVASRPQSPQAEAYRTLRTNLHFVGADASNRRLVITSAVPGEGK